MSVPKVPVPPTRLELKRRLESAGSPVGFQFPWASLVVRVTVIDSPDTTLAPLAERMLWSGEKIPDPTETLEDALSVPSLAGRVLVPAVLRVSVKLPDP